LLERVMIDLARTRSASATGRVRWKIKFSNANDAASPVMTLKPASMATPQASPKGRKRVRRKASGRRRLSSATTVRIGAPASQSGLGPEKAIWKDEVARVETTAISAPIAAAVRALMRRARQRI
jgi:hypothetical protein